jgi:FAD/FMN-containing dehydrogenase/Fe-S oxidoreductase
MPHQAELAYARPKPDAPVRIGPAAPPFPRAVARALARDLEAAATGEVRFDDGSRALYSTDASNYRQVPIGVVVPRTVEDVVRTVEICRGHGAPILSRGGGTSLAGQCCNVAVVLDWSKYLNRLIEIDPERRLARCEPGMISDNVQHAAERWHLTFGPDPSTHDHNTIGGMLGNNSCGVRSVMAGRTADNVRELEILTYDGLRMRVGPTGEAELQAILAQGGRRAEIYRRLDALRHRSGDLVRARYPKIPRRVSGYNLDNLLPENGFNVARALVGTEGTCVTILEATIELVWSPPCRALAVLGFPDIFQAGDAVPAVLEHGPVGLEGMDDLLIEFMKAKHRDLSQVAILPEGKGWLIAEFGGATREEAEEKAQAMRRATEGWSVRPSIKVSADLAERRTVWKAREAGLGSTAFVPHHPDSWEGWEDSAVPPAQVGPYLRDLKGLFRRYGYDSTLYGHFGDGCIHCRIDFGLRTPAGVAKWRRFMDDAADLVVSYGGSLSGEHGDGQSRAELLPKMFGPELVEAFREFKAIWDPHNKMNPGKVVDPYPITSNLRLGPAYHPPQLDSHFAFRDDEGNFGRAAIRCVGVGKCRQMDGGESVMCPSFRATREEKHSTRGRARLLFEMLHGGAIEGSWHNDKVEEALDLCLGCKGCKHDCPVNVDMATYKAEFRAHHYAGHLRPRAAYSMGLIWWWARAASQAPALANLLTRAPGLSALAKWIGGVAWERTLPPLAGRTFREWFTARPPVNLGAPRVLLWPDTFNNYFRPATAVSATLVLERLGFHVVLPDRPLCCGRPLYDWGMLDTAKSLWRRSFDTIGREVMAGTPLVGLEPACLSAFRDELPGLFPDHPVAKRIKEQSFLFSEFLDKKAPHAAFPRRPAAKAVAQIHCHHHAVLDVEAERRLLERTGVDAELVPTGCCGMAGSFGFESDKYPVSLKIAEETLLPALRAADPQALVLADGFSCREQIEQATGRRTRHAAEFAAEALGLAVAPTELRTPWRKHLVPAALAGLALYAIFRSRGSIRRSAASVPWT